MSFSIKNIKDWLDQELNPSFLEVIDESAAHVGHAGVKSGNSEITHILVRIQSDELAGMGRVQQHQRIYQALDPAIRLGLHAIRIDVLT